MVKELSKNVASVSKGDSDLKHFLRQGHSLHSALGLALHKIHWFYDEGEYYYKEFKTVYHVYIG